MFLSIHSHYLHNHGNKVIAIISDVIWFLLKKRLYNYIGHTIAAFQIKGVTVNQLVVAYDCVIYFLHQRKNINDNA